MDGSIEIRPLSKAEFDNINGGGHVGNWDLYYYNRMRDAGLTNPATETKVKLQDAFLDITGPKPPVIFG